VVRLLQKPHILHLTVEAYEININNLSAFVSIIGFVPVFFVFSVVFSISDRQYIQISNKTAPQKVQQAYLLGMLLF